jgi:YfiH family protein
MADDKTRGRSLASGPTPGAEREAGRPDHHGRSPAPAREEAVGDLVVPRLELASWRERFGIVAGITTRGRDFSLGLWSEEPVGQVMTRWRAVRTAFRPRFPGLVLAHQVHGTSVAWHPALAEGWLIGDGQDGHATDARGLLLAVTVADCVPIYLTVPGRPVVALLHAGWRGTAGGILGRAVELLTRCAAVRPSDIVMHCGVGICGACYEVGSEVLDELSATAAATGPGATAGPRGSGHADLRALLVGQAAALGVEAMSVSPWCSAHDRAQFFSHRASGGRDGRMIAYVGLPLA